MRNERDWAQYDDCEAYKFKKKTATNELYRSFDEFKAKFRNEVEAVVYVVTSVAVFSMAMMVYMVLRVEQRQINH